MASKADRAAIAIISTAHGAVRVLLNERRFSRLDLRDDLEELNEYCANVRDTWSDNVTPKDIAWTLKRLDNWGEYLNKIQVSDELQTKVLVKIGMMSIGDLLEKINNTSRKKKLQRIYSEMEELDNFTDRKGTAFLSMKQADVILDRLYQEIGFMA